MNCAKTAEPIDLPFCLWNRVGRRMHKFKCIRQVAPVCTSSIEFPGNAICQMTLCCELCKMAEPINLPFALWSHVGGRKNKFNRICHVSPWKGTLAPHCEYD